MEKQLPKNWTNTELSNLISHVIGGDWGKEIDFIDDDYIEVLCIRGSEIKNWNRDKGSSASLRKIKKSSLESRKLELGDILLEISGGGPEQPVGRTIIIDYEALAFEPTISKVCTNFLRLLRLENKINSPFINHYLQFFYNSGEIVKYQGGSNNLRNLKYKEYETIKIPLPPLAEQNRIVAKLDSLFAQLETIKSSMANVPLLLKDFRQQVLTQAVTGKLTEEWRKGKNLNILKTLDEIEKKRNKLLNKRDNKEIAFDNPTRMQIPNEWENVNLWDLSYVVTSGSRDWSKYYSDEGAYFVRSAEINNNKLRLDEAIKVNLPEKIEGKRSLIEKGNLLITITGANVGKCALIEDEIPESYVSQSVAIIKIVDSNISKYIHLTLLSRNAEGSQLENMAYGMGRPVLSLPQIKSVKIPFPSIEEQQEIVYRVESLFAKADAIEKQYESLKEKIDSLPQAILHKAFKGELTEQLDSDGDASELLKEIEVLKATRGKIGKKVGKTIKQYNQKEVVLDRVAEPDSTDTFTEIINQLNFNYDYEIAAIVSLTFGRFQRSYGKKYIHKMFSNIEFLNTLPVCKELTFQENHWGMFSYQIAKAIEQQKFIQFEITGNDKEVISVKPKHIVEVGKWIKNEENKEFVTQVNDMLSIYEKDIIAKKMDNIELFNTVLECIKVLETYDYTSIYTKMKNWKIIEPGYNTKADKFKELETQSMIDFVKEIKNDWK